MLVKDLIKSEIEKLPESLLEEVFDFIQFLETKRDKVLLVKASQEMSSPALAKIWDNEEDAVYDSLQSRRYCPRSFSFQQLNQYKKTARSNNQRCTL